MPDSILLPYITRLKLEALKSLFIAVKLKVFFK